MAKKEKIEVISEETTVVSENIKKDENIKTINNFDKLTIQDLYYLEKVINVVCKKYENTIKNYDGSISTNTKEYEKFKSINTLYNMVINKIENELLKMYDEII